MIRFQRTLRTMIAAGALAAAATSTACFTDGPVAIFPGGPLRSGEIVEDAQVDWSGFADTEEIELESGGRSRTTWLVVIDGEAYVPCNLGFPPFKSWHEEALVEPDAVVRVEGKRYLRSLERVDDPALKQRLFDAGRAKYSGSAGPSSTVDGMWYFHLAPRATS